MYAEKVIIETDPQGKIISLPKLPANAQIEAIFLVLNLGSETRRRLPSSKVAGKGKITGEIMSPVVDIKDGDVLN